MGAMWTTLSTARYLVAFFRSARRLPSTPRQRLAGCLAAWPLPAMSLGWWGSVAELRGLRAAKHPTEASAAMSPVGRTRLIAAGAVLHWLIQGLSSHQRPPGLQSMDWSGCRGAWSFPQTIQGCLQGHQGLQPFSSQTGFAARE